MALLWACSGVMETVFLKGLAFLCALHLVQEQMLGRTLLGFLQTVLAAERVLSSLLHDGSWSPSPPADVRFLWRAYSFFFFF